MKMVFEPIDFLSLSISEKNEFFNSFDNIISDCDGVIWNSQGLIKGAVETMNSLSEAGKRIFYLTNNSTKTKEQLLTKFRKFNFRISENNVFNTSSLTAKYLKDVLPPKKIVYIVGSNAIQEELLNQGIESFGPGKDENVENILENISSFSIELRDNVGAVVVGFDQFINYVKMLKASSYLKNENCIFVCTNTDETFPTVTNYVLPGSGAVAAGIRTASGREPFIIGKPSTYVAEVLLKENQIDASRTLFVGDRCNTDILMGNKCSFKTLLVLTGIHNLDDVSKFQNSNNVDEQMFIPQYFTESLADLIQT